MSDERGLKVKPLEWSGGFAHTSLGLYYFLIDSGGRGGAVLERHEGSSTIKSFFQTGAEAKAAAQKDYEQRIMSALEPPSAPQCCMCGKTGLSTVEGDDGTECELADGRWVCSQECYDRALEPLPETPIPEQTGVIEAATFSSTDRRCPKCGAVCTIVNWSTGGSQLICGMGCTLHIAPSTQHVEADGAPDVLSRLRAGGWMVAVHNDYRLDGQFNTFWLLTHPSGRWVKGEGASDAIALNAIMRVFDPFLKPSVTLAELDAVNSEIEQRMQAKPSGDESGKGGWQPIETAPRDGTPIILAGDRGNPSIVVGWQNNDIVTPDCFNTAWGNWWPTHWQPLPAPPTPENNHG